MTANGAEDGADRAGGRRGGGAGEEGLDEMEVADDHDQYQDGYTSTVLKYWHSVQRLHDS